ncbi:glycosyltransferase [Alteribacter keqinensis]|uniref:Glycosyltransferase n=1 Tax=Alteribacter keqinensis TaxID=2483800 RepID=A0A3M7TTQ6_9BACI|nr:glycosyltransferase [Alteribacter keqinensis]RNA67733.1 glycosyltransferase [Alteribacter keqinensis]
MKIIHFFGTMNRGGAELRTLEVIDRVGGSVENHFCVLSGKRGALDDKIIENGGKIHYLKFNLLFLFKLYNLLKNERPNVVHSHVFYTSGLILLVAKFNGVKGRISHFRSSSNGRDINIFNNIKYGFLKMLTLYAATDVIGVSETTMKAAIGERWKENSKCQVIYNGIKNNGKFKKNIQVNSTTNLVNVGRLISSKNQMFLVDLLKTMDTGRFNLKLVGNCKTEYAEGIAKSLKELEINNINLIGEKENVHDFLRESQIFLFPTEREGLPGALLEALYHGLPCIVSDIDIHLELKEYFPKQLTILPLELSLWKDELLKVDHSLRNGLYECDDISKAPFDLDRSVLKFKDLWSKY